MKIQILSVIEKCIGWILVYPFLGAFLIKSAKRMCICEYVIFSIDIFKNSCFDVKKEVKPVFVLVAKTYC